MSALAAVLDERLAAWRRDTPGCQGRTEIVRRQRDLNLNTSAAISEDGSPVAGVRVSPHYYNTREEVDTLVDAIEALIQEERR